jgi:Holliday junction DNA helicase RuvA
MIEYIRGKLIHKSPVDVTIETAMGMAFDIRIPISTFEKLPATGNECVLLTHLHIAQDDIRLFGFWEPAERDLFRMLNRIGGIGPKIALSILSTLPVASFVRAIEHGDETLITKVPGIGKKSAQRLIVELKGSLLHLTEHFGEKDRILEQDLMTEVEGALLSLGFNAKEVARELSLLPAETRNQAPELIIKETIRRIYQRSR